MLYSLYEAQHLAMTPMRMAAELSKGWFGHPFSPWAHTPLAKEIAAGSDLFLRVTARYDEPEWAIDHILLEGVAALSMCPGRTETVAKSACCCPLIGSPRHVVT